MRGPRATKAISAVVMVLVATAGAVVTRPLAAAGGAGPVPDLNQIDPPRYSYSKAIVEHLLLPTRDGITRSWVDLIRPSGAGPVPTIIDASPYFNTLGRGWKSELKTPFDPTIASADPTYAAGPRVPFPEWYASYFVPRGYAVALIDLRGTRNSSGCEVYGGREEETDVVDDIDYLVSQSWSNGKVGLIGGSYDGTLATGVAAEMPISGKHKDAVAAIVPVRAIDRWYDYQFYNGAQAVGQSTDPEFFTAQSPAEDTPNSGPSGDSLYPVTLAQRKACPAIGQTTDVQYASPYQNADSSFYGARDFLKDVKTWRAATFIIHGLFDFNVMTMNSGQLWQALPSSVPKKLWYFNGDHLDPDVPTVKDASAAGYAMPYPFQLKYREGVHRWFLQFLKGVDSGALLTPAVEVQRDDGHWDGYSSYPATTDLVLHFNDEGRAVTGVPTTTGTATWRDDLVTAANFLTEPFGHDVRISGQLEFDLQLALSGPDTTIGVAVEDIGPGVATDAFPPQRLDNGTWSAPFFFSAAFLRMWYRDSVRPRGASVPTGGGPVIPGQVYSIAFPSLYTDYIVHAGHRLLFTFSDSPQQLNIPSLTGGVVSMSVGPGLSQVRLPVAAIEGARSMQGSTGTESEAALPNSGSSSPAPFAYLLMAMGVGLMFAWIANRRRAA